MSLNIKQQPAKVYDLTILASALGKFQVKNLNKQSLSDLNKIIDYSIKQINVIKKPFVVHNDHTALDEIEKFIRKLSNMVLKNTAQKLIKQSDK